MNISEFAKAAGVSKSAVSRYFNDGYLSEDKRRLIEAAIENTGYAPSVQAQNVRTKVTKLVGVILPKLSSESCARVAEGISQVLNDQGYQILLVNTANDPRKEVEYLSLFQNNRVDGVIFLASVFTPLHEAVLKKMRVPVIIVGQQYKGFSCVCHDDYGAAYALTELMLKQGRGRPAYIGVTTEDKAAGLARKEGFLKALSDHGVPIDERHMVVAKFHMESGYEKAAELLRRGIRPDCLFCATDAIAAGAMICCRERGIRIPDDMMMVSVGDSGICRAAAVPLTSAHLHYKTSGFDAAEMLLTAMRRNDCIPRIMRLDYEIRERASTGGPQSETV